MNAGKAFASKQMFIQGELLKHFKSASGDRDIDVRMSDNCKDLQSNLFIQNLLGWIKLSDIQPSLIKI